MKANKDNGASKKRRPPTATDLLEPIIAKSKKHQALVEREFEALAVARQVYDARTAAGLSQKQLAALVGTTQSVIARLEDADYQGHSLKMLRRIAKAMNRRVEVRLVPGATARAA